VTPFLSTGQWGQALEVMIEVVRKNPDNSVYKRQLSAALEAEARRSMTQLPGEVAVATSAAQVALLEQNATRISGLGIDDEAVRAAVADLRRIAAAASRKVWVHGRAWPLYAFALILLVVGAVVDLLVFAPLIGVLLLTYVVRHRKPQYVRTALALTGTDGVQRGI
jgi:hypothetical protein